MILPLARALFLASLLNIVTTATAASYARKDLGNTLLAITNRLSPSVDSTATLSIREFEQGSETRHAEYIAWFKGRHKLLLQTTLPRQYRGRKILIVGNDLFVSLPEARRPIKLPLDQRLSSDVAYADMAWIDFIRDYRPIAPETERPGHAVLESKARGPYASVDVRWQPSSRLPISTTFHGPNGFERICEYHQFKQIIGTQRPTQLIFTDPRRKTWHAELSFINWNGDELPDQFFLPAGLNKFALVRTALNAHSALKPVRTIAKISQDHEKMVHVHGGTFLMGTDNGFPDERPAHSVIVRGFWMDRCEVTISEYMDFATLHSDQGHLPSPIIDEVAPKDYFTSPEYRSFPVVNVSWFSASDYCRYRGKRLPTEAEWEWAARGSDKRLYPWGNQWDRSAAVFRDDEPPAHFTSSCRSNLSNSSPFGVSDLSGNVAEWISDWYIPYPGSTYSDPSFGEKFKVARGGSWLNGPSSLTSVARDFADPSSAYASIGIRCVQDE